MERSSLPAAEGRKKKKRKQEDREHRQRNEHEMQQAEKQEGARKVKGLQENVEVRNRHSERQGLPNEQVHNLQAGRAGNPVLDIRRRDRKRHNDKSTSGQAASGADDREETGAPQTEEGVGRDPRAGPSREDLLKVSERVFEMGSAGEMRVRKDSQNRSKDRKREGKVKAANEQETGLAKSPTTELLRKRGIAEAPQAAGAHASGVASRFSEDNVPTNISRLGNRAAAAVLERRTAKRAGMRETPGDNPPTATKEGPDNKGLKRKRNGESTKRSGQKEQPVAARKNVERQSGVEDQAEEPRQSRAKKGTATGKPASPAGPSGRTGKGKATGQSTQKVTASEAEALTAGEGAAGGEKGGAQKGERTADSGDVAKTPRRNPTRNAAGAGRKAAEIDRDEGRERHAAKHVRKVAQATGQARRKPFRRTVERYEKAGGKEQDRRKRSDREGARRRKGVREEKEGLTESGDEEESDELETPGEGSDGEQEADQESDESEDNAGSEEEDEEDETGGDDDEDGALVGGEDEADKEKKPKTRIFEVVHWVLRSMMKMSICTLVEGVGIWELQDSGAHLILAGQKLTAAGGQSSRLLQGSDVFHRNAPLAGTEEQMERDGRPEWQIRSREQRDGIRGYLKTVDHVTKTAKWTDKLLGWDHVALAPLRKSVFGGLVILPGPEKRALVLDLRGDQPGVFQLPAGTKHERLVALQRIAMPAAAGEEAGEHHPRQDLAFVFEVKGAGREFNVQDFTTKLAVDRGAEPFREFLRRLNIGIEHQRFLLKWLALILRRDPVPALMVQSSILSKLLLNTFIPPAAICTVKMHEALPANSPSALAYLAVKCSDIGPTLATTNPLCSLVEQRDERASMVERGEVASSPPPLLLDCAPRHLPALAAGAEVSAGKVRVVLSNIKQAEVREISDDWENPAYRRSVQRAVVFAAVQGAVLLKKDGARLLHKSSPRLLSELGRPAVKVDRSLVKSQKEDTATVLQATLEGVEHAAIIAYDPDDKKGVDFRMLCVVALLRSAPKKWKAFEKDRREGWKAAFETAASESAKLGRPFARERMFQAGQRGSNLLKRVEALGSCSVFDAIAGPNRRPESSGGSRVTALQILGDDLALIFPQHILDRYPTCLIGECKDSNSAQHLRELCILQERLARRKLSRESPLAFLSDLKDKLEAQHAEEFPGAEFSARGEHERQDAEALEQYVQRLARQVLKLRKTAADRAAAAAEAAHVGEALNPGVSAETPA